MTTAPDRQQPPLDDPLVAWHEALLTGAAPPPLDDDAASLGAVQCLKLFERVRRHNRAEDADRLFATGGPSHPCDAGPSESVAAAAAGPINNSAPRQIGRFRIERRIGEGGCGVVFLAVDPLLGRRVALKVPRPEAVVSSSWRSRFLREAEAAALLDHPQIVPVFEVGQAGSLCYIVQAWCEGTSLDRWLAAHGRCRSPAAAQLIAALAEALQHAHSRGVLHRDIKPSNILLEVPRGEAGDGPSHETVAQLGALDTKTEAPQEDRAVPEPAPLRAEGDRQPSVPTVDMQLAAIARLADFGLARLNERDSDLTQSGAVVGTPSYMAPEQAEGRIRDVGAASDVYSLAPFCSNCFVAGRRFAKAHSWRRSGRCASGSRLGCAPSTPTFRQIWKPFA